MALNFNNPRRNYDDTRNSVRFSAYDSIMEVEFFVDVAALEKLHPQINHEESDYLLTFDRFRKKINAVANTAYKKGRQGHYVYVLKKGDF